jgi:hypothetical protein
MSILDFIIFGFGYTLVIGFLVSVIPSLVLAYLAGGRGYSTWKYLALSSSSAAVVFAVAALANLMLGVIIVVMITLYLAQVVFLIKKLPRKIKKYDRRTTD